MKVMFRRLDEFLSVLPIDAAVAVSFNIFESEFSLARDELFIQLSRRCYFFVYDSDFIVFAKIAELVDNSCVGGDTYYLGQTDELVNIAKQNNRHTSR
jgi:hypothetical protein